MRAGSALALGAASGMGVVVAGPPDGIAALVFVALVPLLVAAWRAGNWGAAGAGAACGLVIYALGVPWIGAVAGRMQGLSGLLPTALAVAFVAYHSLPYALASLAARTALRQSHTASAVWAAAVVAAWWVAIEWSFPMLLPWTIGSLLGPSPAFRQTATLAGPYGLTFLVVFVNALLATALSPRPRAAQRNAAAVAAAAVVLAAWGGGHLALARSGTAIGSLRVAIIQGGLAAERGDLATANAAAWTTYAGLTRPLAGEIDLAVWPESTLRVVLRRNPPALREVEALAAELSASLLLGAVDQDGEESGVTNSALMVGDRQLPGQPALQVYDKLRLVAFAEYLPFIGSWMRGWQTTGQFVPGRSRTVMTMSRRGDIQPQLAPSICFEAIIPGWFNDLVRDGASVLVNLTDDGWFADPAAAAQHLEMTRLRAVETRRWLVRASNSGVSAIISPDGEIAASLPYGARGVLRWEVPLRMDVTPYVRLGDWVVFLSALIIGLNCVMWVRRRRFAE